MKYHSNEDPWINALNVLIKWSDTKEKLSYYLELLDKNKSTYALSRSYFLNVVKHKIFLEYFIKCFIAKPPQRKMRCFLMLVVGQLWKYFRDGKTSDTFIPLVNGWVERSKRLFSQGESRFVNAVLRKTLPFFQSANILPLSIRYSTPEFLLQRYRSYYGEKALLDYLKWNDKHIVVYIRSNSPNKYLKETSWPNFYTLDSAENWQLILPLICEGKAYVQDPMTRVPIELLQVESGMSVLDLCAAPGGKTLQIAQALNNTGCVVAVDLPGHLKRLKENIRYCPQVHLLGKNILELTYENFKQQQLPTLYDRVLIDVPCSNTGVVRRKPDVLYRLNPADFDYLPKLQLELLKIAEKFVKPGGLLVYSTCSIDPEENQGVIERFLEQSSNFRLINSRISLPWIDQHDGGGAFCLRKQ